MKVYKCIVTGDELFTDTYPIEEKNGMYRIKAKLVSRSDKVDESKLGANPSAEEAQETSDDAVTSGVNVVLDNRLQPTAFGTKKEYLAYIKDFIKKMQANHAEKCPDFDVEAWKSTVTANVKVVTSNFGDYEFFTGESLNPEGTIALLRWETPEGEVDEVPYMYFFVDGTSVIKV